MASDLEIQRVRTDTEHWRAIARRLLAFAKEDDLTDWELDFLESLLERTWLTELSYKQAESLLVIRDDVSHVANYMRSSVTYWIRVCCENRFGIEDERKRAWVVSLHGSGAVTLRKKDARKLWKIADAMQLTDRAAA